MSILSTLKGELSMTAEVPLFANCVVLRQKDSSWIISSAGKEVLCPKEASSLSLSSATLTARSTGILVKSETKSKDTNSSQALRVLPLLKSAGMFDSVISVPNKTVTKFSQDNQKLHISKFFQFSDLCIKIVRWKDDSNYLCRKSNFHPILKEKDKF